MSVPGFLEKLLDGASVEWVPLGQLVDTITPPSKVQRSEYRDVGKIPIVDQGITYISGFADDGFEPVKCDEYVIFGDHTEHIKYVDFAFIQGADGLKILRPKSDVPKYVYHALLDYYQKEQNYKRHWSKAKETRLPIPCPDDPKKSLAIQAEIVRILDAFTELTAELTTELTMRKKQYNHYREQILDFEGTSTRDSGFLDRLLGGESVEWKLLKNLTVPIKNIKWNESSGSYQYIDLTSVDIKTKAIIDTKRITSDSAPSRAQKLVETDDLLFATTRPTQQRYCLIDESLSGQVASTGYCVLRAKRSEVLPKWILYYISTTDFKSYVEDNQSGAAYPAISDTKVKEFNIPIPCPNDPEKSLTIQAEIVRILDKFDTLTTSLSEGLPREIKLREQQYEYYRDLLLNFPKPEEGT